MKPLTFNVSIGTYENVFRLDVPVNDIKIVKIFEEEHHLSSVEFDLFFGQFAQSMNVGEQFASGDEFEHQVHVEIVFEG